MRATKLLVGVFVLLALAMPTTVGKFNLATSTYLCTGYAGCQAAGYGNAGYRQASSAVYWRMYTGHNCTNYVAYRLIQSGMPDVRPWEGSGNASNWGVAMAGITDQTPTVGSVAWYKPNVTPAGANGHVAYVEQVISDTEIIVSEDYWGGDFYWRRITKSGGGWPTGFIHFNDRVVAAHDRSRHRRNPRGRSAAGGGDRRVDPYAHQRHRSVARRRCRHPGRHRAHLRPDARREGQGPDRGGDGPAGRLHRRASGSRHRSRRAWKVPAAQLPAIQGVAEVGQTLTLTTAWAPQPAKVRPSGTPTEPPFPRPQGRPSS